MRTVSVDLAQRPYTVTIGEHILAKFGDALSTQLEPTKVLLLSDENVAPHYAPLLQESLSDAGFTPTLFTIPAGESSKSFHWVEQICETMATEGLDRHSALVALGGGVIGDLGGFAAASYMRGIPVIQVPTTIVAQVDSAIGGKTGVNLRAGKNLAGAFHQPLFVWADTATLATLPKREFNEGFAEVIKHAAIADASLFPRIAQVERPENLDDLIEANVRIKAQIVVSDERETSGQRALLNFGHTIGHAIEQAAGYGRYLHGEAIALGMLAAARLSQQHATLQESEVEQLAKLLEHFQLPLTLDSSINKEAILKSLQKDKKFTHGKIRFVLLHNLGEAYLSTDVTQKDVEEAIEQLFPH